MDTQNVILDRTEARRLYRKYKEHLHHSEPAQAVDREVCRAYQLIAQGRLIIKALESVQLAGLGADGFPKLALAPADALGVECRVFENGAVRMDARKSRSYRGVEDHRLVAERGFFQWPRGAFGQRVEGRWSGYALVPGVPLDLRPKRGLANYHILWEAEWKRVVARDPFLLRRIGKADLWAVCSIWELTEVERAALSTRIS